MGSTGLITRAVPRLYRTRGEAGKGWIPIWQLRPEFPLRHKVPFGKIMEIVMAGFDDSAGGTGSARAIRTLLDEDEALAGLIDDDALQSGGPLARARLVYEDYSAWRLHVWGRDLAERKKVWRIERDKVKDGSWRSLLPAGPSRQPEAAAYARPTTPSAPGGTLTRREHASVEFTSPAGSRVIVDPIFRSTMMRCAFTMPPPAPGVTAAFVTHGHGDHFDLATLHWLAASGTAIYVPPVPRRSMLTRDMFAELEDCGLPAKICETGTLTQVGDIRVEALPFFGEQPSSVVSPAEPGIRNWGNCYRVETPGFSAFVLADSGVDPSGSTIAAISDSVARRGAVDVVVGCLRHLYMPFDPGGLTSYYSTLPVSGLRDDHELYQRGKLPSSTLGISGTAMVCAEARAKIFLPYAHGLTGYGRPILETEFGPGNGFNEFTACAAMADELRRIGADTEVLSWNPGDCWAPARRLLHSSEA